MYLIRTIITRLNHVVPEIDALTPRLLADAGIERTKARGVMGIMIASFTSHAVDMIRDQN